MSKTQWAPDGATNDHSHRHREQGHDPGSEGNVRNVLGPSDKGTRVQVAIRDVEPGKTSRVAPSDRTQVVYILEGKDAKLTCTLAGQTSELTAERRAGVYLEPGEEAAVLPPDSAALLLVTVPKHTAKPTGSEAPVGYVFEETNSDRWLTRSASASGPSGSTRRPGCPVPGICRLAAWRYAPHAHSPRHVHHPSKTSPVTPEHFYLSRRAPAR